MVVLACSFRFTDLAPVRGSALQLVLGRASRAGTAREVAAQTACKVLTDHERVVCTDGLSGASCGASSTISIGGARAQEASTQSVTHLVVPWLHVVLRLRSARLVRERAT